MYQISIDRPGGYENLCIRPAEPPRLGPGMALVSTHAIGVNFADCAVRMGLYESAKKYVGWPITPGFELSGTVKGSGEGVRFAPGSRVFGVTRFGAYATAVAVPDAQLFPVPASFDMFEAATFATSFLTAWYALRELVKLRPGMRVLIHSAAGGVGIAMVQIAKVMGCEVIGIVGAPHKVEVAADYGADHVIDKSREPLWPAVHRIAPDGVQVVCDANGVETLGDSYRALSPTGRLIVYGFHAMLRKGSRTGRPPWVKLAWSFVRTPRFSPFQLTSDNKGVLVFNLSYLFDHMDLLAEAMGELLGWVEAEKIRPLPVEVLPFEQVREAHRALESGQTVGKLALSVVAP